MGPRETQQKPQKLSELTSPTGQQGYWRLNLASGVRPWSESSSKRLIWVPLAKFFLCKTEERLSTSLGLLVWTVGSGITLHLSFFPHQPLESWTNLIPIFLCQGYVL